MPQQDLTLIYCLYVRSVLEFNSCVWFSTITEEEKDDIERVQRCAVKLILKNEYQDYENGLLKLNLKNFTDRRQMLALRFANKCKEHDRFR